MSSENEEQFTIDEFEASVSKVGPSSVGLTIPQALAQFLGINPKDKIILKGYKKEKGKFIAFWKKKEEKKNE